MQNVPCHQRAEEEAWESAQELARAVERQNSLIKKKEGFLKLLFLSYLLFSFGVGEETFFCLIESSLPRDLTGFKVVRIH